LLLIKRAVVKEQKHKKVVRKYAVVVLSHGNKRERVVHERTIRSPIWVGGGKTFAAVPRNFMQKVNRKMYQAAMRSILSRIAHDGILQFIDNFEVHTPKTKEMIVRLKQFNVQDVLIICSEITENLYLAARNLGHVNVIDVALMDPVALLSYKSVLVTKDALALIEERFA